MASHEGFGFDTGIAEEEDLLAFGVRRSLQLTHGIEYILDILGDSYHTDFAWHFSSGHKKIIEAHPTIFQDVDSALMKYTRLPFYQRFSDKEAMDVYRNHHLGTSSNGVGSRVNANKFRGRLALCTQCRDERDSFRIWDRLFLTPGIFTCDKHLLPLVTFCSRCYTIPIGSKGWRPPDRCTCKKGDLVPVANLDSKALSISNFISTISRRLLRNTAPSILNGQNIMAAIFRQLDAHPYTPRTLLNAVAYDVGGKTFIDAYQFGWGTFRAAARHKSKPFRNCIQILALAGIIFGDEETLLKAISTKDFVLDIFPKSEEAKKMLAPRTNRNGRASVVDILPLYLHQDILMHRQRCIRLLQEHKPRNRTEAREMPVLGQSLRFLMKHDNEWLDEHFPIQKKSASQFEIEETRATLIQEIERRQREIHQDEPTTFIRQPMLFSQTQQRKFFRKLFQYQDIKEAVDRCADTEESFQRRVAEIFVQQVQLVAPHSKYADANWYLHPTRKIFLQRKRWVKQRFGIQTS